VRGLLLLVGLAACFRPSPPTEAPCSAVGDKCPDGQICVGGTCRSPDDVAGDAAAPTDAVDGSPLVDSDGDGLSDADDNCPQLTNANQADEDGDGKGDVCDLCPPVVDPLDPDGDGDGVGDACDPEPGTPGDQRVLFEGFADGIPPDWIIQGGWTVAGGTASITPAQDEIAFLMPNLTADPTGMIAAGVVPVAILGNGRRALGVADPFDATGDGALCALALEPLQSQRELALVELGVDNVKSKDIYPFVDGDPYLLALVRNENAYSCNAIDNAMVRTTDTSSFGTTVTVPKLAVRTRSVVARVAWVMYIDSP
jgi:hypothetical protein